MSSNKFQVGSEAAKSGFSNEHNICDKFKNYLYDQDAQAWLSIMGYDFERIAELKAIQIPSRINKEKALALGIKEERFQESITFKKADMQLQVSILIDGVVYIENLSLKKANADFGYNQIDKRSVETYKKIWHFDDDIAYWLKLFTGELDPVQNGYNLSHLTAKKNRLFMHEIPVDKLCKVLDFFDTNRSLIVSDVLRGRGGLSANWMLVTRVSKDGLADWILKEMNFVCNFYNQGDVSVSRKGSLKIGRLTLQRKGGTPDPEKLQFKFNPLDLFNLI